MTTKMKCLLSALFLTAVGLTYASSALVVQMVQTDDPDAYVAALAGINARIKAVSGIDTLRRTWTGDFAGDNSHAIAVVSQFESAASVSALGAKMQADPELKQMVAELKGIRKLGPSWLYKAARYEGDYPGGAVFNTSVAVKDEAAYLKLLDDLKAIFDANGFKDAKVNLWRIVSGRSGDATHLAVIAFPSQQRVGELLDTIWDKGIMKDWNAAAAKVRTSLGNGSYHEITK
jgi:hypothetical protein